MNSEEAKAKVRAIINKRLPIMYAFPLGKPPSKTCFFRHAYADGKPIGYYEFATKQDCERNKELESLFDKCRGDIWEKVEGGLDVSDSEIEKMEDIATEIWSIQGRANYIQC